MKILVNVYKVNNKVSGRRELEKERDREIPREFYGENGKQSSRMAAKEDVIFIHM